MNDSTQQTGPKDPARIDIDDDGDRRYWSEQLGVTTDQLDEAVHQVGPTVETVREYLATPATGRTS